MMSEAKLVPDSRPDIAKLVGNVLISACLLGQKCRYDGDILAVHPVLLELQQSGQVTFISYCPELALGLNVPRQPVRLVSGGDRLESVSLLQPATGNDYTAQMISMSRQYLQQLPPLVAIIVKAKSPSCGLENTKIYSQITDNSPLQQNGTGIFTQTCRELWPKLPIFSL